MQCSQDCGGYRTRLVVCLIPQTKAVVSNDRCPSLGPRPPTTEFCQNKCKSAEVPHHSDHAHQSCKVILTMFSLPPPPPAYCTSGCWASLTLVSLTTPLLQQAVWRTSTQSSASSTSKGLTSACRTATSRYAAVPAV